MAIPLPSQLRLRLVAALAAVVVVAALSGPVAAAGAMQWVVPSNTVLPTGALVVGGFPLADAMVVSSAVKPAGAVAYDTPLQMQSLPAEADPVTGLRIDSGVSSTGAPQVWEAGELGAGAVVALIDTGIAPVEGLADSVVGEIDFSGDGGGDGYGHGTFMASLIAANAAVAPGSAPHTGILSLKVGRHDGSTSLGSVLSAMQWLHGVGRFAGIRIATLALGVDADTDAAMLLDRASEALAASGMLLVTAAGNDGRNNLTSPATAEGTFSVGAFDDNGTADSADDRPAGYSGTGVDRDGVAQPDIKASGTRIVGWMAPDSVIARENPVASIEGVLFRGSGTSMSTALTAGVAALASSARPDLDGAELADALRASGATLDAPTVVAAAEAAPAGTAPRTKWESAEDAPGAKGKRKGHDGNAEPNGVRWGNVRWGNVRWGGVRWGGVHFNGVRWGGVRWGGVRWGGVRWGGVRWGGVRWGGSSWGDAGWEPGTWGGVRWTDQGWVGEPVELSPQGVRWGGVRWGGEDWGGVRWGGVRWGSDEWSGVRWGGVRWGGASWSLVEGPPR